MEACSLKWDQKYKIKNKLQKFVIFSNQSILTSFQRMSQNKKKIFNNY